ncbi:DUF3310 domain-containing protein [Salicibibacter cibarius]|uniref:DUF3310 domain-containing protein n=1 Tax=Salicibibacter cibarius TaxID=2743000 RepID=A0A7T6Z1V1_9BACI|nr:DUF3310 domain-containing protein [Salicibibacter cibarius]QQK75071.1 DUF3310 domain-containing protein [Salicibibacter cibarius]QQK75132.1 DUF3310 domain-containing protein [Salicibibacter cibarius]
MGEGLTKEGKREIGQAYWNAIKPDKDNINSPDHYTSGDIECIDAIKEATKHLDGFEGYLTGNIMKYLWRYKHKNGVEDLKKASVYLKWLEEYVNGNEKP